MFDFVLYVCMIFHWHHWLHWHWLKALHTCIFWFTHAFTMYAEHLINSNMVGQKRGVGPGIYEVIRCSQLDSIGGARTVVRVSPVFFRIVSSTHWGFKAVAWRPDWQVTCSMRVPCEFKNTLWMHVWIKKYMYAKLLVNACRASSQCMQSI